MKSFSDFNLVNATNIDEAVTALSGNSCYPLAGGTDLLGVMRFHIFPREMYPKTVVNLKSIAPSLHYLKEEENVLKIGALTPLEDIAKSTAVKSKWGALAVAAHEAASPHLREMGTIGGNICQHNRCWYFWKEENRFNCLKKDPKGLCYAILGNNKYHSIFGGSSGCVSVSPSDLAPALVVLNANVVTTKRTIPIEDFFAVQVAPNGFGSTILSTDEIVTEIQIPAPSPNSKSTFVKFALRSSIDFPIVNCAAVVSENEARICLNAVSGTPKRAQNAEDYIKGKIINEESANNASIEALKDAVALPYNKWKIQIAKAMVKKALLALA